MYLEPAESISSRPVTPYAQQRTPPVLAASAVASFAALVALTALRLAGETSAMDANATHLTGRILRGAFDALVSSLWPVGEPQLGIVLAALLAGALFYRGRRGAAVLVVVCFLVATGLEVAMRIGMGLHSAHGTTIAQALVHQFPSGHTARIPLLGGMAAALVRPGLRAPVLATTVAVAILESMDRVDSTIQSASDVIGGLLLGTWLALTFAIVLRRVEQETRWDRAVR
jgi:membrane-associated phospholipid phosphatase